MDVKAIGFAICAAAAAFAGGASADVSCRVEPDYSVRLADKPGEAYVKVTLAAGKVAQPGAARLGVRLRKRPGLAGRRARQLQLIALAVLRDRFELHAEPARHRRDLGNRHLRRLLAGRSRREPQATILDWWYQTANRGDPNK